MISTESNRVGTSPLPRRNAFLRPASGIVVAAGILLGLPPNEARADLIAGQRQPVVLSDATALESFGFSVAIDGDTAVVGTPNDDTPTTTNAGAAYVFVRNTAGLWEQRQRLVASNGLADNHFGETVALSGRALLVGAADRNSAAGVVYAFRRSTDDTSGTWSEEAQLVPNGLAASDTFGNSLSLSANTALIGAQGDTGNSGAAYVFVRGGGSPLWTQQGGKLLPAPRIADAGFGFSVAVDGDLALIGAPGQTDTGAVFAFRRTGATWGAAQALAVPAALPQLRNGDAFGSSVALSGSWGLVGAPGADVGQVLEAGSAFFFEQSSNVWVGRQRFDSAQPADTGEFGTAVDITGSRALIGAPLENGELGQVHLFGLQGASWLRSSNPIRPTGTELAGFGVAATIGSTSALVGSPQSSCVAGADCGAVHFFSVTDGPLPVPMLGKQGTAVLATVILGCGALMVSRRRRLATNARWS